LNLSGTPVVSDVNTAAGTGDGLGAGDVWNNAPISMPPNGHTNWITVRDVGSTAAEEIVGTSITGLTIGRSYEVVIYSMSAAAPNYSPQFINFFDYKVGTYPRVSITAVI
jgi:hypothetical protein